MAALKVSDSLQLRGGLDAWQALVYGVIMGGQCDGACMREEHVRR